MEKFPQTLTIAPRININVQWIERKSDWYPYMVIVSKLMLLLYRNLVATWMSRKFCNILVTKGTIQHLWVLFLRLSGWQIKWDWEMLSLTNSLGMLLAGFNLEHGLGIRVLKRTWLSSFLKPERNFFDYRFTELWSTTAPSLVAQQMF